MYLLFLHHNITKNSSFFQFIGAANLLLAPQMYL